MKNKKREYPIVIP